MKKVIIITKQLTTEVQIIKDRTNGDLLFFDEKNSETSFPKLNQYDEVWVWDTYFDKLITALCLIYAHNNLSDTPCSVLRIYTNTNFDANFLENNQVSTDVIFELQPFISNDNEIPYQTSTLNQTVNFLTNKIAAFKNEIELRWPDYFLSREIYLPTESVVRNINFIKKEDFFDFIVKEKQAGVRSVLLNTIIAIIADKLSIGTRVDSEKSKQAISKLFSKDILELWTVTENLPSEEISETNKLLGHLGNQIVTPIYDNKEIVNIIDQMEERFVSNADYEFSYFVTDKRDESIIIVNALGLSINLWSELITLLAVKYQVIVWETRCGDIEKGGMESVVSIQEHASDVISIVKQEKLTNIHVLAWCNGARIGVELANSLSDINSLILLAPSFRGVKDVVPNDTQFEAQLDNLFSQVEKAPKNAGMLADFFTKMASKKPKLESIEEEELLGYANYNLGQLIFAPMSKANYLINYGIRTFNDESYDLLNAIQSTNQKTLLILGENDNIVSNKLIGETARYFKDIEGFIINGGSHYMHFQNAHLIYDLIHNYINNESRTSLFLPRVKAISIINSLSSK